jgi:hypothetical protein
MRADAGRGFLLEPVYCGVSQPPWFGSFHADQRDTRGSVVPAWAGWIGSGSVVPPPPPAGAPPITYWPE